MLPFFYFQLLCLFVGAIYCLSQHEEKSPYDTTVTMTNNRTNCINILHPRANIYLRVTYGSCLFLEKALYDHVIHCQTTEQTFDEYY